MSYQIMPHWFIVVLFGACFAGIALNYYDQWKRRTKKPGRA